MRLTWVRRGVRRTPRNFWMYGSIGNLILGRMFVSLILIGVRGTVLVPVVRPDTTVGVCPPRVVDTCGTGGGLW